MIFKVPFRISGYIEVEACDGDEAWEAAHEIGNRRLADEPSATVDFEVPECQE